MSSELPPSQPPHPRAASEEVQQGIRDKIKDQTERIPLRALERRGFKSVQVLDMRTIERIVHDAVEKVFHRHNQAASTEEREALTSDAKAEFLKLLQEHKQLRKQKDEVEGKRQELAQQVEKLRATLHDRQHELSQVQAQPVGEISTFSTAALAELDIKVRELFGDLIDDEKRRMLALHGPSALRGLGELERELAALIGRLLDEERDRWLARERAEHQQKIDLLERRIEKLNKALKDTESTLYKVAHAKGLDAGLASVFGEIQGLSLEDPNFGRKSELLREIFVQNLEIQGMVDPATGKVAVSEATLAAASAASAAASGAAPRPPAAATSVSARTAGASARDDGFDPPPPPVPDPPLLSQASWYASSDPMREPRPAPAAATSAASSPSAFDHDALPALEPPPPLARPTQVRSRSVADFVAGLASTVATPPPTAAPRLEFATPVDVSDLDLDDDSGF